MAGLALASLLLMVGLFVGGSAVLARMNASRAAATEWLHAERQIAETFAAAHRAMRQVAPRRTDWREW